MKIVKLTKPEAASLATLKLGDEELDEKMSERLVKKGLAYWMGGKALISEHGLESLVHYLLEHE